MRRRIKRGEVRKWEEKEKNGKREDKEEDYEGKGEKEEKVGEVGVDLSEGELKSYCKI